MSVAQGLRIAEVLQNILSHCDHDTNYHNALVCKSFSEIALDLLWYKVIGLKRFLQLFGKLEENDNKFKFTETPSTWRRFEKIYQTRIRILELPQEDTKFIPALRTLASIRNPGPLLPKLHTLEWFGLSGLGLAEPSVMFMHEGIRNFRIVSFESIALGALSSFCEAIGDRMPFLSTLELFLVSEQAQQKPLLALTRRLMKLETFSVPAFEDPSILLLGLRDTPELCLKNLLLISLDEPGYTYSTILHVPNSLQIQGFRNLQQLGISCSYTFALLFLQHIAFPGGLRSINVSSDRPEVSNNLRNLISHIASSASRLTSLVLRFNNKSSTVRNDLLARPSVYDMLRLEDLSPLLRHCPNIESFTLVTPYPLALNDDDMESIAKSWPHLTVLQLCSSPGVLLLEREMRLTLKSLLHFSCHCSALKALRLYVDATGGHLPDFTSMEVKRFKSLDTLDLGHSPIDHHARVAHALAQLCSFRPQLISGSNWADPDKIATEINSVWKTRWDAVSKALEVVLEMQETIDNLREEVKDLRRKLCQV